MLYQDQNYIAVHKPSGLLVHRTNLDPKNTVAAAQILSEQIKTRVFTVHRLDRPTSGVLLFALSSHAAMLMARKFESREVEKKYVAVVRGHFDEIINLNYALKEENDEFSEKRLRLDRPVQEAQTILKPLAKVELPIPVDRYPCARYSLIEANPKTGRRHQIRRHLSHLRFPIVGDINHGVGIHNRFFREHFGIHRLLLASTQLSFQHPINNERITIDCDLAPELKILLHRLGWGDYA